MVRGAQALSILYSATVLGIALTVASCSSVQEKVSGWLEPGSSPEAAADAPQAQGVYYAGIEGLKMYSEPSASSKVVGALVLHEKVTRSRVERGYAYVQSARSSTKGWVDNARLIWRLPSAPAASTPSDAISPEDEVDAASPADEATAPPAGAGAANDAAAPEPQDAAPAHVPAPPTTMPSDYAPSVLDAY